MSRKKSSPSNIPAVDGRHNMTSLELSEADDLATLMTVDAILGFTTHKMDKNFNPSFYDKKLRDRWKEIMEEFIAEPNYENTYHQLVCSDKIKPHWKKDERFKRHIFRFLYLFDKRSGIEVRPCFRYENEDKRGAAIFATREWEKGSQITTLFGCISEVRPNEEEFFHETKNEFSVMYSTRKNCSQLWLGPAAYVNHDCKPNCRFTEANYDSKMTLETLRDIHANDELLIYYGNNFFGIDNAECECFTCELRGRGFFNHRNQHLPHQLHLNNNINTICFSPSMRTNNEFSNECSRRVMTRSAKLNGTPDNTTMNALDGKRVTLTHSFQGALNGLKKSDNTYSLRITYSRIDRVKKRIQSRNQSALIGMGSVTNSKSPERISLKSKIKRKTELVLSPEPLHKHFKANNHHHVLPSALSIENESVQRSKTKRKRLDCHIVQRRSLRQANAKNVSSQSSSAATNLSDRIATPLIDHYDTGRLGKLTIKLRKTADHPNQYEHCLTSVTTQQSQPSSPKPTKSQPPPIQKLTIHRKLTNNNVDNNNIFSRMTQLYLSRPSSSETVSPPQSSDTPPFLSPWFCCEDKPQSSSQSPSLKRSRATTATMSKLKIKLKPTRKSANPSSTRTQQSKAPPPPVVSDCYDNGCESNFSLINQRETASSSDIPSYSASSPTIPILEIESETELVPPKLVCELLDHHPVAVNTSPSDLNANPSIHDDAAAASNKSKGIVMKFSRICGNRFISLLS